VNWPSVEGSPMPLGVTYIPEEQKYNFALYSKNATEVTLLLFNKDDYVTPLVELWLEHLRHKTQKGLALPAKRERTARRLFLCLSSQWSQERSPECLERL
jgi:isoamylase